MRVFIADSLPGSAVEALCASGHDVTVAQERGHALRDALKELESQVLVVRSTRVTEEIIRSAPALELIVRAGAGYDTIDVKAACDRGVFLANCPGKNAGAVAELTVGLMLALDRRIPDNVITARAGRWEKGRFAKARGLCERTIGVIGFGQIGMRVVRVAQAIGMRVVGWSRSLTDARAAQLGVVRMSDPIAVASASDVVTLHVAATPETKHLADARFFEAMRPGALFINTARGSVVDEAALKNAISDKGIRAGLDVHSDEPAYKSGALTTDLADLEQVYLTHHIGASTAQAQEATASEAVRVIETYSATSMVENCVNLAATSSASHLLTVRHLDRIGVLARVLDAIRKAELNVQEMENQVFAGESSAAVARIRVSGQADDRVCERIRGIPHVLAVSLIAL